MVLPTMDVVWESLKKPKIESSNDPAIPSLDIYPKVSETGAQTDTYMSLLTAT